MTAKSMRPPKLPLLGSNQDSPDPESEATTRLAGAAETERVVFPSVPASVTTISPTISHPRFRHGDAWLRSLPNRAPKDSPTYREWKRKRDEGYATRTLPTFDTRDCRCGAEFRPVVGNQVWCSRTCPARTVAA